MSVWDAAERREGGKEGGAREKVEGKGKKSSTIMLLMVYTIHILLNECA